MVSDLRMLLLRPPHPPTSVVPEPMWQDRLWRQLQTEGWRPTALRAEGPSGLTSDPALLEAFLAGDESALRVLYHKHFGKLVGYARKSLPNEAEDLVNDTFMVLYQKAKADKLQKEGSLPALLFGILRLEIKARLRKQVRALPPIETDETFDPWPTLKARHTTTRLVEAMNKVLNPLEQDILVLDYEGHTGPEIAQELELSEGNVRVIKHRAKHKLQAALKDTAP